LSDEEFIERSREVLWLIDYQHKRLANEIGVVIAKSLEESLKVII